MDVESLKPIVIDALEDMKAQHIIELDVMGRTSVTDLMIIANGTSSRHVQAVADNVSEKVKEAGIQPLGAEGRGNSDWVLIDLGDIIVHVMTAQAREFYDLERLWGAPEENSDNPVAQA
jgi:ribosome-associated protein